ncbi:PREDICTED: uncharacterized protein LOC104606514 [Nelumbo nucifera]|uniref:Uncharacterized protein n=2 Tax=Nelumbo nucifera TaxID=4432 RepID=A0A822XK27_NELNU|nr:PREDICTED: uncharacterized protein LOC104606514 [Nelumbo nucifera]DAD20362.1 TPA_asm: hypothetical protein HUJ06_021825 [Nelumbo nucifera]
MKMGDDREALLNRTPRTRARSLTRCFSNPRDELQSFRSWLRYMCVDQSNTCTTFLSWTFFLFMNIVVPLITYFFLACRSCDHKHRRRFDGVVQLSLSSVATVSFLCLSAFIRKYGLRRFLFLDKLCDESEKVRHGYIQQLNKSLKMLAVFVVPSFAAESSYKIWWYSSGKAGIPFLINIYVSDTLACALELCSWLYRTSIFFLVCVLFRLICYLQILRIQDFAQVFQKESNVGLVLKEHLRIRRHLRIISHRFRAFILYTLTLVTASLFACLLVTTRAHANVTILKSGELAMCSITLVTGLFICLRSAIKITHKAQSIKCLAALWHVFATIDFFDGTDSHTPTSQTPTYSKIFPSDGNDELDDEEEDNDGDDDLDNINIIVPAYAHTISFQKRQALVTYFENNGAGITVYGFLLDRTFLHTIVMVEMSLVLWILGKTIGIS